VSDYKGFTNLDTNVRIRVDKIMLKKGRKLYLIVYLFGKKNNFGREQLTERSKEEVHQKNIYLYGPYYRF
jgi:hypothetical protein